MRRFSNTGLPEAQIDMTSMLDIVFIMLIFFIVTATFLDEQAIALTPPPPVTGEPPSAANAIVVFISKDNMCSVAGTSVACESAALSVEAHRADKVIKSVILRADARATHRTLVTVHDQITMLGLPSLVDIMPALQHDT